MSDLTIDKIRQQNRERQKRFYEKNKVKILQSNKEMRQKYKQSTTDKENNVPPLAPVEDVEPELPNTSSLVKIPIAKRNRPAKKENNDKLDKPALQYAISNFQWVKKGMVLPLADGTKERYNKNLNQILKLLKTNDLTLFYNTPQKYINVILDCDLGILNKVDLFVLTLKLLNHGIIPNYPKYKYDILNDEYLKIKKESDSVRTGKTTSDETAVDNIDTLRDLIVNEYNSGSKEDIILCLYTEVPKRDDFHLKIVVNETDTTENINYIIVPNKKTANVSIFIKRHKTDGKYDAEVEPLSTELSNKIRNYLTKNELKTNDYLFKEAKMGTFIKSMFAKVGKPNIKGSTELRKTIISNVLNNKETTVEQAGQLAKTMKHNIQTQQLYKRKIK
jgi:hypothetical protein